VVVVENGGELDLHGCTCLWARGALLEGDIKQAMLIRTPDGRLLTRECTNASSPLSININGWLYLHRYVTEREASGWLSRFDRRSAKRLFGRLA
jgi:hypothetical protein